MTIFKSLFFFFFSVLIFSCANKPKTAHQTVPQTVPNGEIAIDTNRYATGFLITRCDGYILADVIDPWKKDRLLQRYILIPRDRPVPENLPQGEIIKVPIRNVVVYTGLHYTMIETLEAADGIIGVCEPQYINNEALKKRLKDGNIIDMGEAPQPNIEKMLNNGTEVIIASPFQNGTYGAVEKTGIPVIKCADYMEKEPLGSAEWLRFLGFFTGREQDADSIFKEIEDNYLKIKSIAANVPRRPTILSGMRYGSTWYVPAGDSFMAHIYRDAGADYLFDYIEGSGGAPLSFETVLDHAIHADFWFITYNREQDMTYQTLEADYTPYNRFDAFRNRSVYGCNASRSLYHEQIPLYPDRLLEEIIAILHPELITDYYLKYFSQLKE